MLVSLIFYYQDNIRNIEYAQLLVTIIQLSNQHSMEKNDTESQQIRVNETYVNLLS